MRRLFESAVRVSLDWSRVVAANPSIATHVVTGIEDVRDWWFPWYVDGQGRPATWDADDVRPLSVGDARLAIESDPVRRVRVTELAESMLGESLPSQFLLATYALPDGAQLVLDGNHRLCAVVAHSIEFVALAVNLEGPIDSDVLPDLCHWRR
jgi:hypothetical protein